VSALAVFLDVEWPSHVRLATTVLPSFAQLRARGMDRDALANWIGHTWDAEWALQDGDEDAYVVASERAEAIEREWTR